MAYDRFLIAAFQDGWRSDLKPWLIPDEAFAELNNAYVFRGRIRKRFGSELMGYGYSSSQTQQLFSRLRINIDTTDGSGDTSGTVPGNIFGIGQLFSIGDSIYTVYQTGTPAAMLSTDGTTIIASYNTSTGAYNFVGAPINTDVWFYPAEPAMGLTQYEGAPINNWPAYAFDTQFAYVFAGGFWQRSGTGSTPLWHGTNDQYYWSTNWQGLTPDEVFMFTTNFNATVPTPGANDDPIWFFDGTSWATFQSAYTVTRTSPNTTYIQTARIIVPFKNRLVMLNTIEQTVTAGPTLTNAAFPQRARFCHYGSPFSGGTIDSGGTNPFAWLEPNQVNGANKADGGGFIDAATDEAIVSAEFIKDRLIVYFERSTWELAYTGNQVFPFSWQKLNTELGSEATFSSVPFDQAILTIGNTGVHSCNGVNVQRIDDKIPDYVFQIIDKATGVARVAGIRDYYTEMVYWTFPSTEQNPSNIFSTKILTYNYKSNSWGVNDDSITCWGYFEQQQAETWASSTTTWETTTTTWDSGPTQAQFRQIIAGNQEGFVFIVSAEDGFTRNADALQITNIFASGSSIRFTVINHNLNAGDYIYVTNVTGLSGFNGNIFKVVAYIDVNTFSIGTGSLSGTYEGGGTIARVSNIGILSKQWNPYVNKGRNFYLARIDFGVTTTSEGQVTVDYYPSYTSLSMLSAANATNMIMGNGILETFPYPTVPLEVEQSQVWHPIYFQTEGESVQIVVYMNPEQITNPAIAFSDFELQGLVLHTMPTSQRLQ